MTVNIELISQTDLADESFYIAINGLEPRAMYCVEMYLSDYYCINAPLLLDHDVIWKSTAIFLSDQDGMIDTSQTASISGSYKGVSEMGLFFNAKPLKNRKRRLPSSLDRIPLRDCFGVEIKIKMGKDVIAEQSFVRRYMNLGVRYQDIYDKHFQGRLFCDEKLRRAPAVIIVSGSEGRIEKAQNIAQLLSSRGYICLAIAYFGLEGLPQNLERIPIECLEEAKDFLYDHPRVDNTKIGIYGRSKGAELVLAGQSILDDVQCLVLNSNSSSWTYLQKELPYQKFQLGNYLLNKFFGKYIPEDSRAQIDVSKISSPLLLLGSDVDEIWNASSAIDDIISHYKGESILFKKYHETGHMLTVAYQPNHRYRKDWRLLMKESVDSWFATISFFDTHLKNL
ncbi:acyl-CoA thioesterase/BAAT N-terminal domain-containing protein [Streptococcus pseudopneumoniae]|uniref:acyl-CoA thioesterase/BAAT N-terminal domain-containing protein n=1 Tax=Streptococcus pseudopneumoniae TaxID=257758 RepID=UPI0039F07647